MFDPQAVELIMAPRVLVKVASIRWLLLMSGIIRTECWALDLSYVMCAVIHLQMKKKIMKKLDRGMILIFRMHILMTNASQHTVEHTYWQSTHAHQRLLYPFLLCKTCIWKLLACKCFVMASRLFQLNRRLSSSSWIIQSSWQFSIFRLDWIYNILIIQVNSGTTLLSKPDSMSILCEQILLSYIINPLNDTSANMHQILKLTENYGIERAKEPRKLKTACLYLHIPMLQQFPDKGTHYTINFTHQEEQKHVYAFCFSPRYKEMV